MTWTISAAIITATIVALSVAVLPLSLNAANAYVLYCGPLGLPLPTTFGWRDTGLSSYLLSAERAIALWNDIPAQIQFKQVFSFEKVQLQAADLGANGLLGVTAWPSENQFHEPNCDSNGYLLTPATITLNKYYLDSASNLKKIATVAHELGHALGLDHSDYNQNPPPANAIYTLMYSTSQYFDFYNIFYPTLDDIRAAQSWYGVLTSTATCTQINVSGTVTYSGSGTCSPTNPRFPITEKVLTAGTNNRAFASQSSTQQLLPSSDILMITAKVKPDVLEEASIGVLTSNNPTTLANRFMTIRAESGSDWETVRSDTFGSSFISPLCTCPPSTSTTYFVQIVLINGENAGIAVYQDDGGGANHTPPTHIVTKLRDVALPWTSQVYYGTNVWTRSSSSPLSQWTISQYHNRLNGWS